MCITDESVQSISLLIMCFTWPHCLDSSFLPCVDVITSPDVDYLISFLCTLIDSVQTQASALDDGKDSVMSQEVSSEFFKFATFKECACGVLAFSAEHPDYLILLRSFVSRRAVRKGRAVLEGVGLDLQTIETCFRNNPQNEEEAVQAGLTVWSRGHGSHSTWGVLLAAMDYAAIAHADVQYLKNALARGMLFTLVCRRCTSYICVCTCVCM